MNSVDAYPISAKGGEKHNGSLGQSPNSIRDASLTQFNGLSGVKTNDQVRSFNYADGGYLKGSIQNSTQGGDALMS